jgi:hypothetical protein
LCYEVINSTRLSTRGAWLPVEKVVEKVELNLMGRLKGI